MSETGANLGLPALPRRDARGHKGTFGTVGVIGGGCAGGVLMIGAPALAAEAALRAGCGLAKLAMPEPILAAAIGICPSATGLALPVDAEGGLVAHEAVAVVDRLVSECQCLAVGPGLGVGRGAGAVVVRAVQQEEIPVVVDADALSVLAGIPELSRDFRASAVLTPHPGEFRRLSQALKITHDPAAPESRGPAAEALAQRLGCIVVLKGANTVVSDGLRGWTCSAANAALATAGTGDVLTGLIAGLAAQFAGGRGRKGDLDLFSVACLGVEAHARCAESWVGEGGASAGLLAKELCSRIPRVLEGMRA